MIDRNAGDAYIQHHLHVESGKEALIAKFELMAKELPGKYVEFTRVLAEGDLVVLHRQWPGDHDYI